jgi:DUF971 family protein
MEHTVRPTSITADRQARRMTIAWSDGQTCVYSFTLLREACPCAECRGGHEKMGIDPGPEIFALPERDDPATRMQSVEPVGTYGLTIAWEDGHHYGIYNWGFLRRLCPPDEGSQASWSS